MGLRLSVEVYSIIDILSYNSHIEESYMGCCARDIQSCTGRERWGAGVETHFQEIS